MSPHREVHFKDEICADQAAPGWLHAAGDATLLDRVRKRLDDRGTLDVLRHGVELLGLRQPVALAQFKPALAMNPATLKRYPAALAFGEACRAWFVG